MNPLYCSQELPAKARIVEENLYSKILLGVHITLRHQLTWHKLGSHTRSMSRSRAFPNAQYWSRHRRSCFKIAMKIFGPLSCHTQYLSCNPLMPPNVYKSKKQENHRFFFARKRRFIFLLTARVIFTISVPNKLRLWNVDKKNSRTVFCFVNFVATLFFSCFFKSVRFPSQFLACFVLYLFE